MSNDRAWDIVTSVIEPLAERLEAASKAAYPAGKVSSVTLDVALMHSHFEAGRRLLEFSISPAYARVFQRTIEGPIIPLRRLENKTRFKTSLRFKQYCRAAGKRLLKSMFQRMQAAKGVINNANQQISKMWDEVEHSGGAIAWEWVLRRSHHGTIILRAKERVDTIGSRGDPASLHLSTVRQAWQPGQ
jgi:hypothetical protein